MANYFNSYPPSYQHQPPQRVTNYHNTLSPCSPAMANKQTPLGVVHEYQPGPQTYGGTSSPNTQGITVVKKSPVAPKINILPSKPNNYRSYSIFVMICSCWICGLVALIYSCKVDSAYKRGDIAAARKASERARKWNFAGVLCGVMDFVVMAGIWLAIIYGMHELQ